MLAMRQLLGDRGLLVILSMTLVACAPPANALNLTLSAVQTINPDDTTDVTVTATITPWQASYSGTIVFTEDGVTFQTANVPGSSGGVITAAITNIYPGSHSFSATYTGAKGAHLTGTTSGLYGVTPYQLMMDTYTANYMQANCSSTNLAYLNGTQPFIILKANTDNTMPYPTAPPSMPAEWSAQYVLRFASEYDMEQQFANGVIPTNYVTWIMYDNEPHAQPATPPNELADPPVYYEAAAALIHNNGLKFFATAGLSNATYKAQVESDAYLYDAYDVQTQTGENIDPSVYYNKSKAIADAFLANNPNLTIAVGIGNYAGGQIIPNSEIESNMEALPAAGNTYYPYLALDQNGAPNGGNIPMWANFGPNPAGPGNPGAVCTIVADTLNSPPTGANF